jgi:hypothetical protein
MYDIKLHITHTLIGFGEFDKSLAILMLADQR